jgi:hypothetical protein
MQDSHLYNGLQDLIFIGWNLKLEHIATYTRSPSAYLISKQ